MLFWRPPGNRKPSELEIDICRPFVERHITLVNPHCLIFVGGTASAAMLPGSHGITRIRGRWMSFTCPGLGRPIQVMAMYHPSFLLRSPERKRDAWVDLLSIKSKLEEVVSN
jgi:DNA polymerase